MKSYLDIEDSEEPYLDGIKYHAMPPLKRFRDMEHLSGGEKTMAALALLFAIHSYQPSPFFVLDEVDAALDNTNVARIANYIRDHAAPGMQFIVISLKTGLFQNSEALVGIYRDQSANSSKSLTLDVSLDPVLILGPGLLTLSIASKISVNARTLKDHVIFIPRLEESNLNPARFRCIYLHLFIMKMEILMSYFVSSCPGILPVGILQVARLVSLSSSAVYVNKQG